MKNKQMIKVYWESNGKLTEYSDNVWLFGVFLIGILTPVLCLVEIIFNLFRDEFYVTKEDYHKQKLKELE